MNKLFSIRTAFVKTFKKSEAGSIINIGSISGILGDPGTIAYGSSKASFMYAKVMSNELSRVFVLIALPSITDTGMSVEMMKKHQATYCNVLIKRKCTTDEISDLVLFLCSGGISFKRSNNPNGWRHEWLILIKKLASIFIAKKIVIQRWK